MTMMMMIRFMIFYCDKEEKKDVEKYPSNILLFEVGCKEMTDWDSRKSKDILNIIIIIIIWTLHFRPDVKQKCSQKEERKGLRI